jgi:chorismate mutase/prephenate dehydratase
MRTVHFLGPEGTFAHAAALTEFHGGERLVPGASVLDVFETVAKNPAHLGVVPIENSIEGSVSLTLEALSEGANQIVREIVIEVEQCLVSAGTLAQVRTVMSHPHALAQCKHWLRTNLPKAELVTTPSTAAAAFAARGQPHQAAVASALAGKLAGLQALAHGIQDRPHNATRFVVLGHEMPAPSGADKTSILFDAPHQRGALHRVLGLFDSHGINLSRIESRPMAGEMWHYVFYADLEGHCLDPNVAAALAELRAGKHALRVLGSYPLARPLATS